MSWFGFSKRKKNFTYMSWLGLRSRRRKSAYMSWFGAAKTPHLGQPVQNRARSARFFLDAKFPEFHLYVLLTYMSWFESKTTQLTYMSWDI